MTAQNSASQNTLKGLGYALAAVLIWTGFILISKAGAVSSMAVPDMLMVRFGTACLLFSPFIYKHRKVILQWRMFVLGAIGGVAYGVSVFTGFALAPATHAALLLPGLMPVMIAVLAYFIANERHRLSSQIGIALSSTGIIALLAETLLADSHYLSGDLSFVVACLFWGIFTVLLRRWQFAPWHATLGIIATTTILFVPVYILFLPHNIAQQSFEMLGLQAFYQGVMATTVQMVLYARAVHILGATKMGGLMALVPVFASTLAVPMFNEQWTNGLSVALVMILAGTLVSNLPASFFTRKRKAAAAC